MLTPRKGGGEFELVPAGTFQAVCNGVWDIGRQKSSYMGKERIVPKLIIRWEIEELMTKGEYEGKRFCMAKFYRNTTSPKGTLRKDIEAWRGQKFTDDGFDSFDIEKLVSVNCMLTIAHSESNGQTYANIIAVTGIPKNMKGLNKMIPENKFELLDWVKKMIDQAEPEEEKSEPEIPGSDEIPF